MGKRSAANGKVGKRSAGLFRHAKPAAALVVLAFAGFGAVQVALSQVASLPSEVPLVTTTSAGATCDQRK